MAVPVHKVSYVKKVFPVFFPNFIGLQRGRPHPNPTPLEETGTLIESQAAYHTPLVVNLSTALEGEWGEIPAAMFQGLLESLPRRVEDVLAHGFFLSV